MAIVIKIGLTFFFSKSMQSLSQWYMGAGDQDSKLHESITIKISVQHVLYCLINISDLSLKSQLKNQQI